MHRVRLIGLRRIDISNRHTLEIITLIPHSESLSKLHT